MTYMMELAGIDVTEFAQHASHSATAAHLRKKDYSVKQICYVANWSQSSGVYFIRSLCSNLLLCPIKNNLKIVGSYIQSCIHSYTSQIQTFISSCILSINLKT